MADFQFYRPQVNALERLWAQYAEAEGSKGGAFMRGLAPGLEALGKGIREERAAAKEREFEATQTDIKLAAEEKRHRQDEIAANKRLVIGMQSDERIANDRLKAEQAAAAAKRAQGVADATLVFGTSGLFSPEESAAFGETVADRGAADAIVENRRAKLAADAENAEKAAAEARIKEAQGIANKTLGELLAFDGITPSQGMAYTARLQAGDPDDMQSVMNELNSLRVDVDARRGALAQFDAFDADVKKIGQGEGLALPKDTEAFGKAQSLASAAAAKLRDKRFMAAADDNLKRATLNALTDNVFEMRRMIGMVGLGDPEYTAQIAKNYPGLERLAGKNVLFANGRISGDPQQNAQFRKMVDDRLKDDFQLRTELKALGVGDGIDINLLTGNIGAAMPDAAPDIKAQTEKLVLKAKDRLSQQVLEEMGVKFNRVSVPQGYTDVGSMDEAQRTKFGADLRAAAMAFMAMKGRGPTKTEGQQMMADMGYWDINAPTLRKTEPKPKEAPKAKETPKAKEAPKETPKTAQAQETAKPKETSKPPTPEQLLVRQAGQGQRPASIIGYGRPAAPSPKVEIDTTSPSGVALRIVEILRESEQLGPAYRAIEGGAVGALNVLGNMSSAVGRGTFFPPGAAEKQTGYRQYIGRQLSANQILPGVPNSEAEALVRRAIQQQASLPYNPVPGAPEAGGYMNYPVYQVRPPRR